MDLGDHRQAVSLSEKVALLRRHTLFRELYPTICGTCLFAVMSGIVQITAASTEGKSAVFNQIRAGEIFGEIALLDGQPRTADAAALTDCILTVIERRDFLPLLRGFPDVAVKLLELLCSRLRRTSEQVEDIMFLDLESRLIKTLLRLSKTTTPAGQISISQSELSQIVGLSREMTNKQLQVWVKRGWITLAHRRIVVERPDVLARIALDE
jgi:CRP-like cAMP-binding protein